MVHSGGNASGERTLVKTGEFKGRSFRLYSDGVVKAASSAGWLPFANYDDFVSYHTAREHERKMNRAKNQSKSILKRFLK